MRDITGINKLRLTNTGLVLYTYRTDEVSEPKGTLRPIDIQPFTKDGHLFIDEFEN